MGSSSSGEDNTICTVVFDVENESCSLDDIMEVLEDNRLEIESDAIKTRVRNSNTLQYNITIPTSKANWANLKEEFKNLGVKKFLRMMEEKESMKGYARPGGNGNSQYK